MRNIHCIAALSFIVLTVSSCPICPDDMSTHYVVSGMVFIDDKPAVGAEVQVRDKNLPEEEYHWRETRFVVGDDGKYVIYIEYTEANNHYFAAASMQGYKTSYADLGKFLDNWDGKEVSIEDINIFLEPIPEQEAIYSFSGRARADENTWAAGAWVKLMQNNLDYGSSVLSDADGNFTFNKLEEGTYSLILVLKGYYITVYPNITIPNLMQEEYQLEKYRQTE